MRKRKYLKRSTNKRYEAIVIGVSAGGINALTKIISNIPGSFQLPLIIVQHISPKSENYLIDILSKASELKVKEVEEKEPVSSGIIYVAPPNYHVLVDDDRTIALSTEDRISFARPSIDVLFESAAFVYTSRLIGIILTGANKDGAIGLKWIKDLGGMVIVQNPATAEVNSMPIAAIQNTNVDYILNLDEIGPKIVELSS